MYKTLTKQLCITLFLCLALSSNVFANENEKLWFTLGVDPILFSAGHMSVNYTPYPYFVLSARTAGVNDVVARTISLIGLIDGAEYAGDAGLLAGLVYNGEYAQLSASAGLAYVDGRKDASFFNDSSRYSTMGIPLEIQAFWKPTDHFGIGLIGFGNINDVRSFGGAVFALRLSF